MALKASSLSDSLPTKELFIFINLVIYFWLWWAFIAVQAFL